MPSEPDPFADLGEGKTYQPTKASGPEVVSKVIAGIGFLGGAGTVAYGVLMLLAERTGWEPPFPGAGRFFGGLGLGICALSLALYDRRWPFSFLRKRRSD